MMEPGLRQRSNLRHSKTTGGPHIQPMKRNDRPSASLLVCVAGWLMFIIIISLLLLFGMYVYKETLPPLKLQPSSKNFIIEPVTIYTATNKDKKLQKLSEPKRIIVTANRITKIESASQLVSLIDKEKYDHYVLPSVMEWSLVPGLVDYSATLLSQNPFHFSEYFSILYLMNGVTGIAGQVAQKDYFYSPRLISCLTVTSSPSIAEDDHVLLVNDIDDLNKAIQLAKDDYFCISIKSDLPSKLHDSLISLAFEEQIPTIGLLPKPEIDILMPTIVVPQLSTGYNKLRCVNFEEESNNEEVLLLPTMISYLWKEKLENSCSRIFADSSVVDMEDALQRKETFLLKWIEEGKKVSLGTETISPFNVPGFSLRQEMLRLYNLGVPLEELWVSCSAHPLSSCSNDTTYGLIEEGAPADFLLFQQDSNELETPLKSFLIDSPNAIISDGKLYWMKSLERAMAPYQSYFARGFVWFITLAMKYT